MKEHCYWVYILTNTNNTTFYIGFTNDLYRRVREHKGEIDDEYMLDVKKKSFTHRYRLHKLVYYEFYNRVDLGIEREKQLKDWHRDWKLNLIKEMNPTFRDLSDELFAHWYD